MLNVKYLTVTLFTYLCSCITVFAAPSFNLSRTFGDDMVLQAETTNIIWGFGVPNTKITTNFDGTTLPSVTVDNNGIWRQSIDPQLPDFNPKASHTFQFTSSVDGSTLSLNFVKFG